MSRLDELKSRRAELQAESMEAGRKASQDKSDSSYSKLADAMRRVREIDKIIEAEATSVSEESGGRPARSICLAVTERVDSYGIQSFEKY